MHSLLKRYEAFLIIESSAPAGELIRLRALYGFGWLFVLIQLLNIIGMTVTYRHWTPDHGIAVSTASVIICAIHCLRFFKNFTFYAIGMALLCIVGVLASALPDYTGINSALLPLLVMMPVLCSFTSGPRAALLSGGAVLIVIALLYYCSATSPHAPSSFYDPRNAQRALQAAFTTIMVTGISAVISNSIFQTFHLLEANIDRARKAEAAKSNFLASMSHELRTPLNGVLGLTNSLLKTDLDKEQIRLMNAVQSSGKSLLVILNDLLDLSKIDAGKLETTPLPFDPRVLIRDITDTWRESATEKNLTFNTQVDENTPSLLLGDDLRIRQIISNLVSNAVKFTDTGLIAVSLTVIEKTDDAADLQITVRDTGEGIKQSALERIFDPFEQAEKGIARRRGGTGLGLSICRQLADLMQGTITVQSAAGKGSTFCLTVPVETIAPVSDTSELEIAVHQASPEMISLCDLRVLLVEDNKINQMVAQQFLKSLNVEVLVAANGSECLDILTTQSFDVILMDKHMPVMDGVTAMKAIRALPDEKSHVPIIACTADAMTGEREEMLQAGFSDFLAKPLSPETLETALHSVLSSKKAATVAA